MIEKKLVIIILNYLNYQDTEECVNSILNQIYKNYHILIVDNGSSNESYAYLKSIYKSNSIISIIRTRKNYGFAKGNNIGINYAKRNLGAEYILLLNSDTILNEPLYIKKMIENDEDDVGVIGSKILLSDNTYMKKIYRYVTFPATEICYLKVLCENMKFYELQKILEYKLLEYKGNYILHGCVLLLTPAYFQIYNGLDSRTFLYCEEELLYLRCQRTGLREKIVNELTLFHKEGKSSKVLYNNDIDIYNKLFLKSYKFVVLESIKNYMYTNVLNVIKLFRKEKIG